MEFAVKYFSQISEWKDSKEKIAFCQEKIEKYRMAMAKQEELHQIQIAKTKKFAKKTALIASPILLTMVIMIVIYFAVIVPSNRFTIQCDLAGGTASQATTFEYYTWDKEISLFTPTRTGYTFVGWTGTDLSDPKSELILPQGSKGNRSYIANWKANTYTVTLDANGGTCDVTTITVTYDQPYTLPDATVADHDFTGWLYINNRTQYVSSGTWKTPSDITIQANWLPVGLEYSSYETTVFISKYTGTATELIIPSVIKGKNVTQINSMAFSFCASLTRITIPDSVTNIESSAFYNCDSLTSVTIPHSVTSIKGEAFAYCDNLISITFQGTKQEWKKITKGVAWGYGTPLAVIHCTDGDIISD